MKTRRVWKHRTGEFVLGGRTLIMGIVNVTPDSFSDGGQFLSADDAVAYALRLQDEGADLLDFGAESTRPGSKPVDAEEQIRRLEPVLSKLKNRLDIPVSVDTTSQHVAKTCLDWGISIVNDVSAFQRDKSLAEFCGQSQVGVVLMHMRGTPATMQLNTEYAGLFAEIHSFLFKAVAEAGRAGIVADRIVVDPGIGFGKSFEQNYQLLGNPRAFTNLAAGVLVGPSRKAFTAEFSKLPPDHRQFSTAAAVAIAVLNGADIIRVHDVAEMRNITDILDRFREIQEGIRE